MELATHAQIMFALSIQCSWERHETVCSHHIYEQMEFLEWGWQPVKEKEKISNQLFSA